LGQGLVISISAINIQSAKQNNTTENANGSQQKMPISHSNPHNISLNEDKTKRDKNARRLQAKNLSHSAHQLRERYKSLNKNLKTYPPERFKEINQQLDTLRMKMKDIQIQRQSLARLNLSDYQTSQTLHNNNHIQKDHIQTPRSEYYQALLTLMTEALCIKGNVLTAIDSTEKLSIIFQQGGNQVKKVRLLNHLIALTIARLMRSA